MGCGTTEKTKVLLKRQTLSVFYVSYRVLEKCCWVIMTTKKTSSCYCDICCGSVIRVQAFARSKAL